MRAHEHIKFWRDATLGDLELLHATYVTHTFAPHTHEGYMISVMEQGVKQFAYRRSQHTAPVGSMIVINSGEMHTGSSATEQSWTYRALYPSTELLLRAATDLTGRSRGLPFFAEPVVHDPAMMREFVLTHRALEEQTSTLERESRLLWTLSRFIVRYADDHPRPRQFAKEHLGLQRVRCYLEEHYAENIWDMARIPSQNSHMSRSIRRSSFYVLSVLLPTRRASFDEPIFSFSTWPSPFSGFRKPQN